MLNFKEAPQHPANVARDTYIEVDGITQPAPAPRFSETPSTIASGPPTSGAHTDNVLAAAGFTAGELADLRAKGVI